MGTNYYLHCRLCGEKKIHVGKQSFGWPFLSNYSIDDLRQMYNEMKSDVVFKDEYGREQDFEDFITRHTKWQVQESNDPMEWF